MDFENEVEMVKAAEAADALDAEGLEFDSEDEALEAINSVVDEDYTEKVAAVCDEFDIDEIEFEDEEEKVAAAMEIVDGWEDLMVKEAKKKHVAATAGGALAGLGAGAAAGNKGLVARVREAKKAWGSPAEKARGRVGKIVHRLRRGVGAGVMGRGASKKRIAAMIGGPLAGAAGAHMAARKLARD